MRSEQKLQYQSTLKTTTIIPRPGPVSACWLYSTGRREMIHPKFWNQFHVFHWKKRNWFPPIVGNIDRTVSVLSPNRLTDWNPHCQRNFSASSMQCLALSLRIPQQTPSNRSVRLVIGWPMYFQTLKLNIPRCQPEGSNEPYTYLAPRSRFENLVVCNIANLL